MIAHIFKLIWNKRKNNSILMLEIFLSFFVLFFTFSYLFFNFDKTSKPLGFETDDVWMVNYDNYFGQDSTKNRDFTDNLRRDLEAYPEIESASFMSISPFSSSNWDTDFDDNGFTIESVVVPVDFNLSESLNMNVIEGRWYEENEHNAKYKMVINKAFKDKYFPNTNLLDTMINFDGDMTQIIGIVDYYRYQGEFSNDIPIFFPYMPYRAYNRTFLLKVKPNTPISLQEDILKTVANNIGSSKNIITTLEEQRKKRDQISWTLLYSVILICAFLCFNVALGLFGVLSYNINIRKKEIGLRQALGADGWSIARHFILEVLAIAGISVLLALLFCIQVPLLEVTSFDNSIFYRAIGWSIVIIFGVVLFCAIIPSYRATLIHPSTSLKED